ncbi:oligosaccharide biosynthesis protein Alg14 like-domain-containing protein [Xylaria sp. CBS 124048]|nr:oligosaccharide biosynthesis protein Alg14 like-domain-containing protein [Xylaria sp. CBS 124048]
MSMDSDPAVRTAPRGSILGITKNKPFVLVSLGITMAVTVVFPWFMARPSIIGAIMLSIMLLPLFIAAFIFGSNAGPVPEQSAHYVLVVCGSGGHTAEMIQMLERSIRPQTSSHRRWAIGKDDEKSFEKVLAFEQRLLSRFSRHDLDSGTFDITRFGRARYVHQSWLTTPFSATLSLLDIVYILFTPPQTRPMLHYPGVIATNGPGTGFLFLLVARAFRFARISPASHIRTIYVESWARVKSLSLTGKLVQRLGLADTFIVQSRFLKGPANVLAENLLVMPPLPPVPFDG